MDILEGLNEKQIEAVTTTEGYVRVIAGAGSGKTRALASRFAYLVNDLGIMPGHILCVTFTNKSAREMAMRIHRLTGDNDTGYINTFHGFCVSVLQEDSFAVSYPKNFLVIDNSDIDEMLAIIYEEMGLTLRDMPFNKARDMIEMKKCVWEPEYYKDMIAMPLQVRTIPRRPSRTSFSTATCTRKRNASLWTTTTSSNSRSTSLRKTRKSASSGRSASNTSCSMNSRISTRFSTS